jgi:hypothetical protein
MAHRSLHRDPLEQVLIEEGRLPAPRRSFRLEDIEPGWEVLDNADERIGTVESVDDGFLAVHRGFLTPTLYVPTSAIGEVTEGFVALNVPNRWIGSLGWTQHPRGQAGSAPHRTKR